MNNATSEVLSDILRAAHAMPFRTVEEIRAQVDETEEPYFRRDDPLCARFLRLGSTANPESIRALFPFIREGALLGVPRSCAMLPPWLTGAFFAGYEMGRLLPERSARALPESEVPATISRLQLIASFLDARPPTAKNLMLAFEAVRRMQWADVPEWKVDDVFSDRLLESLRCGVVAATVAKSEPTLTTFVGQIEPELASPRTEVYVRLLNGSLIFDGPVHERLRHPLLRMAEVLYPDEPLCRSILDAFLHQTLWQLQVRSENECPAEDEDLETWVQHAASFGKSLVAERKGIAHDVFRELFMTGRMDEKTDAKRIRGLAGSLEPAALTKALVQWYATTHGYSRPRFFAQSLNRVLRCVDMALWVPFAEVAMRTLAPNGDRYLSNAEAATIRVRALVVESAEPVPSFEWDDGPAKPKDDGKFRVLLGIDDELMVEVITGMLQRVVRGERELVVENCTCAEDLVRVVRERVVHLVALMVHHVTPRHFPKISFSQRVNTCSKVIRELRRISSAPVFALSGADSDALRRELAHAGATQFLLLPRDVPELTRWTRQAR